jgi:hypothetical protein
VFFSKKAKKMKKGGEAAKSEIFLCCGGIFLGREAVGLRKIMRYSLEEFPCNCPLPDGEGELQLMLRTGTAVPPRCGGFGGFAPCPRLGVGVGLGDGAVFRDTSLIPPKRKIPP